ncbi:hypothetical protein [Nostoc sp.]
MTIYLKTSCSLNFTPIIHTAISHRISYYIDDFRIQYESEGLDRRSLSTVLHKSIAFLMSADALALQADALALQADALALSADALALQSIV